MERSGSAGGGDAIGERPVGSMIFGAALIAAGVLLGLGRLRWLPIDGLGDLWPLVPIGIGAHKLWQSRGTPATGNGAWLVLAGAWFLLARLGIFGVTWRNSWPVLLILAGFVMVWRSLGTDAMKTRREEVSSER